VGCEAPPPEPAPEPQAEAPVPVDPVARGAYLVAIGGCNDCHTPGMLLGMPDFGRALAGSEVAFFMPGMGYFFPPNLTPDVATGLGSWTEEQVVAALRTGIRPDGRVLSPIMPWPGLSNLTDEDAMAMAIYLRSLAPIANLIAPPTPADQPAPGPYMTVVFPEGTAPPGPPPQ
jgi:mono/diheme cytochrome c family protein